MTAARRRSVIVDLMSDDSADDEHPIVPALHTTPKANSKLPVFVSPEGARFLNDLSNYIPVGSLILNKANDAGTIWDEVFDIATLSQAGLPAQSALDIEKLLARRRLRIFLSGPAKAVLRVYVLPSDYQLPGLKTALYPYQRRSAGQMLQRECEERLELDPRLEERTALDGTTYYYAPWEISFLRGPRYYESCKGGILAETMGLGKTVICITLILTTRGYLPRTPAQYDRVTVRPKVATLVETAISAINRHSAPWRSFFERHEELTGEHMGNCVNLMQMNSPSYEIPVEPIRWNRKTSIPAPKKLTLAATTLVVVPRNLLSQWKLELEKHTTGILNILVMDDNRVVLPPAETLAMFDLVLFSRPRFEYEDRDGADRDGRPLHFLRIIIDEGHGMAAENTRIATVASKLVKASHQWVVSGTPAKDLVGVEMDLVGPTSHSGTPVPFDDTNSEYGSGSGSSNNDAESLRRHTLLSQRKTFNAKDEKHGAVRSIGLLASNFLKIRPWCSGDDERAADWMDHFFRHEMLRPRTRTFSGFAKCLRRTLESVVIRTQPSDVERDIELPPLSHEIVRLEPSFYDKLTVNAFVFVLTANAITSERTDVDYIFHKNSGKERTQLLTNLRASAFYWTGFSASDMEAAIEQSQRYIEKQDKLCSKKDEELLKRCMDQAKVMVASQGWRALTQSHEVGLFVEEWPAESRSFWSFDKRSPLPLLCGATQLIQAQNYVNSQTHTLDPTEGLAGAGIHALSVLRPQSDAKLPVLVKAGIPSSSIAVNQVGNKRSIREKTSALEQAGSPQRRASLPVQEKPEGVEEAELPASSALRKTSIIGTTSAKLSYLLSRIEECYHEEKILVFYDSDNTAYYIAQALEVLHIDYLIYAKSLTPALKSEYVVRFNEKPEHRVLLMDIGQAAYGLNFPSASRVFFINPVNRPSIEAQALKRAHRIGQTRKVHAETLILRDTIEERIFERARTMSRLEHKNAKELEDDGGVAEIIQTAQPVPVGEVIGKARVAFIQKPQPLFARPGWAKWKKAALENSKSNDNTTSQADKGEKNSGKKRAASVSGGGPRKKKSKSKGTK
ncbi:hypothetical protein E4T39_08394 [Aureobasidium subglaciale]|nr:hypothetical protein E4T39_08394 [Aureobasidium subglaciale]